MKKILLSIMAFMHSLLSYAGEDNIKELDLVNVVGSTAPKTIAETTSTVYYITSDLVAQGADSGKTLSDILSENAPSLNVATQARSNYSQNMRGRRVLVMIDGVSLNSSRLVSRQLDSISPENIDHIEISSGANAVYGGNATGGVINIITKKSTDSGLHGSSSIGVTTALNDDINYKLSQSLSGGGDRVQGRLGVNLLQNNAFYDGNKERIIPDTLQGSLQHSRTLDLLTGLSIKPNATQSLDVSAQYYDSTNDTPYSFDYADNLSNRFSNPEDIKIRKGYDSERQSATKRYQLNLNYANHAFWGNQTLIGNISWRKEEMGFMPYPTISNKNFYFFGSTQQDTEVASARLALIKDIHDVKITYGTDIQRETFSGDRVILDPATSKSSSGMEQKIKTTIGRYPDTEIERLAAFTQLEYRINQLLSLEGGYRYEYLNNKISDFIDSNQQAYIALGYLSNADTIKGGESDYHVNLFNFGVRADISSSQQMWFKFSQGFELPDPAKAYGVGKYKRGTLLSSRNVNDHPLSGIKTNNFELGWRLEQYPIRLQTALYYAMSNKAIKYIKVNPFQIDIIDRDRRNYGMEIKANLSVSDHWDIGGSAHISKNQERNDQNEWEAAPFLNNSPNKTIAYINFQNRDWSARLNQVTVYDSSTRELDLTGYGLLDFSSAYKISGGEYGTFTFAINNLLNKQYTTTWGKKAAKMYGYKGLLDKQFRYKGRGRTYSVNYRYTF